MTNTMSNKSNAKGAKTSSASASTPTITTADSRAPQHIYYYEPMPKDMRKLLIAKATATPGTQATEADANKVRKQSFRSMVQPKNVNRFVAVALKTEGTKLMYGAAIWRRNKVMVPGGTNDNGQTVMVESNVYDSTDSYKKSDLKQTAESRLEKFPVVINMGKKELEMNHTQRCDYVRRLVHKNGTMNKQQRRHKVGDSAAAAGTMAPTPTH
jgi:hypothetical protein